MWPKLIPQLFELLPHLRRLIPLADRFFASKSDSEKAGQAAFAALQTTITHDLAEVLKTHAGLYRQLEDQTAQMSGFGEELKRSRLALEHHGGRIDAVETAVARAARWIKVGLSTLTVLVVVLIALAVQILRTR